MKTPNIVLLLLAAWAVIFFARAANASTIADWTFQVSTPITAGPVSAETGSGTGTGVHAGTTVYTSPVGNGSSNSWSANNWAVGDSWQFAFNATGAPAVQIDWDQTSSTAGPRDFLLQFSTDGSSFTTFGSYALASPTIAWAAGMPTTTTHFSGTIPALGNAATAYIRLTDNGTVAVGPNMNPNVQPQGTNRVDNVLVQSVPEPSAFLLGAIGVGTAGMMYRRRFTKRRVPDCPQPQ